MPRAPACAGTVSRRRRMGMDQFVRGGADLRDEVARLEERIEALDDKIENCRKFMIAARIAIVLGVGLLTATLLGAMVFDPTVFLAAIAAVLGGLIVLGSNRTTADETAEARTAAEAERAALIGQLELRVVSERPMLH